MAANDRKEKIMRLMMIKLYIILKTGKLLKIFLKTFLLLNLGFN